MTAHVCAKEHAVDDFEVAVCFRSLIPDACGDQHAVWQDENGVALFAVADGLGHGRLAAEAALTAIATMRRSDTTALPDLIRLCHEALHGTRGAAIMIAAYDPRAAELRLVGIGNVGATVIQHDTRKRSTVMGLPGIIGHRLPRRVRESRREMRPGDTLVIATDGIGPVVPEGEPSRVSPVSVAHAILESASTGDDALVLVAQMRR